MRYLMFLLMGLSILWSIHGMALPVYKMSFQIQPYGSKGYECSSVWNPLTQEALIRVGLIFQRSDDLLLDKSISFGRAQVVEFLSRKVPEIADKCRVVSQWHFDFEPGLSTHLMYLALKGPGCEKVAKSFDVLQPQLQFKGIFLSPQLPVDVIVDIDR